MDAPKGKRFRTPIATQITSTLLQHGIDFPQNFAAMQITSALNSMHELWGEVSGGHNNMITAASTKGKVNYRVISVAPHYIWLSSYGEFCEFAHLIWQFYPKFSCPSSVGRKGEQNSGGTQCQTSVFTLYLHLTRGNADSMRALRFCKNSHRGYRLAVEEVNRKK